MKCYECGGTYLAKHGHLEMIDKYIGMYAVRDIDYYKCDNCGGMLFPPKSSQIIENKRIEIRDQLINTQPLDSFLSASETASLLGITRQALHKHRRIRRGFIYQTHLGGKIVYLKQSVLLFMETEDGRFPLVQPVQADRFIDTRHIWDALLESYGDFHKFQSLSTKKLERFSFDSENRTPTKKELYYAEA